MKSSIIRKLRKGFKNIPNFFKGYNLYVNRDKFDLIDLTFTRFDPQARSFADLGGVWKVNAAYSRYTVKNFPFTTGALVDTDIPPTLAAKLQRCRNLRLVQGDFTDRIVMERIGHVDVVFLFDVLLHQANPDWNQVLEHYSTICSCFVIYNQQFIRGEKTIRLTSLPFENYIELVSGRRKNVVRYIYEHRTELHPIYKKPWGDIHNIWQWGITDQGLREVMGRLGFREAFYRNHGMFSDLAAFENHAFVFVRDPAQ